VTEITSDALNASGETEELVEYVVTPEYEDEYTTEDIKTAVQELEAEEEENGQSTGDYHTYSFSASSLKSALKARKTSYSYTASSFDPAAAIAAAEKESTEEAELDPTGGDYIKGNLIGYKGQGSKNEGTPPSTGYVLKENEHMHHYDTYVRSEKYDGCWHDVYSCSCGEELTWTVDADPCTLHYDGQHEWSEPLDCSHYSFKDDSPCCVCLRCGAKGPLWKSLPDPTPTPKPTEAPKPTDTPTPDPTASTETVETTAAPAETTAQPTEPQDPCANGHDWEYTGGDDDYDFFRCTRCGAEKAERYYE